MSSFQTSLPTELAGDEPLSFATREYFRSRLRTRLYDMVVRKYSAKHKTGKISQRELAARIRRRPEVINRLLASPGNWTLDTISDLLLGIGPEELDMTSSPVVGRAPRNSSARSVIDDYLAKQAKAERQPGPAMRFGDPPPSKGLESVLWTQ